VPVKTTEWLTREGLFEQLWTRIEVFSNNNIAIAG
jgi:hypothetical protein